MSCDQASKIVLSLYIKHFSFFIYEFIGSLSLVFLPCTLRQWQYGPVIQRRQWWQFRYTKNNLQITRSVTGKIRSHSPSTDNISQSPNTIPYTLTHSLIIPLRHFLLNSNPSRTQFSPEIQFSNTSLLLRKKKKKTAHIYWSQTQTTHRVYIFIIFWQRKLLLRCSTWTW